MQAGAGQTNITPLLGTSLAGYFEERKAADIRDELFAKAIVLDDGATRVALVICDLIVIPGDVVRAAREIVESTWTSMRRASVRQWSLGLVLISRSSPSVLDAFRSTGMRNWACFNMVAMWSDSGSPSPTH